MNGLFPSVGKLFSIRYKPGSDCNGSDEIGCLNLGLQNKVSMFLQAKRIPQSYINQSWKHSKIKTIPIVPAMNSADPTILSLISQTVRTLACQYVCVFVTSQTTRDKIERFAICFYQKLPARSLPKRLHLCPARNALPPSIVHSPAGSCAANVHKTRQ